MPLRVAVLGHGAIGTRVIDAITQGRVEGVELVGVIGRTSRDGFMDSGTAIRHSDLVVECAGVEAVREHGPAVVAAGRDLLVTSLGALVDESLRSTLLAGPGRLLLTSGAIGGLDILTAAARDGGLNQVTLTSTKRSSTLVASWMDEAMVERLRQSPTPFIVFDGSVDEAIRLFPRSLNVGVALAMATGMWGSTVVRLVADPQADVTTHQIEAEGTSGRYRFELSNAPLSANPRSSAVVSAAIVAGLQKIARPSGTFV